MSEPTRNAAGQETDQRPWGSYTVLEDGPTFKVKRNRIEEVGDGIVRARAHPDGHRRIGKRRRCAHGDGEHGCEERPARANPERTAVVHRADLRFAGEPFLWIAFSRRTWLVAHRATAAGTSAARS